MKTTGISGALGMVSNNSTVFPRADREIGRRRLRRGCSAISIGGMEEIYCFAGNPLDRASERRRDTKWVASLLSDPAARIPPLRHLRPPTRALTRDGHSPALAWQKVAPWRETIERGAMLIFLGL